VFMRRWWRRRRSVMRKSDKCLSQSIFLGIMTSIRIMFMPMPLILLIIAWIASAWRIARFCRSLEIRKCWWKVHYAFEFWREARVVWKNRNEMKSQRRILLKSRHKYLQKLPLVVLLCSYSFLLACAAPLLIRHHRHQVTAPHRGAVVALPHFFRRTALLDPLHGQSSTQGLTTSTHD